jgi:hypothetical protein
MEERVDLCIVYDDDTKKQAKALYRKLSEKLIRCVYHDEKTYIDTDEKTNTNFNKVLFFSQSLIKENFMPEISTCTELVKGVSLISNGTAFGINVSISWLYDLILIPFLDTYCEKKAKSKLYDKAVLCLVQDDNLSIIIPKKLDF